MSKLHLNISPFEGDPALIDFFFDQIKAYVSINKLKKDETIFLLKSKLAGPAQKYMLENPTLYNATDLEFIEENFKKFFHKSATSKFNDFKNLSILPQESIKNFAHRLNFICSQVYENVKDTESLDSIKFVKFLDCLPSNIRVKIQEENITNYKSAVERAQKLQEIMQDEQILDNNMSHNNVMEKLCLLVDKLSVENFQNSNPVNTNCSEQVNNTNIKKKTPRAQDFRNNFKKRNFSRNNHSSSQGPPRFKRNNNVRCQLCGKFYHTAKNCFQLNRTNKFYQNKHDNFSKRTNNSNRNYNEHLN